MVELESGWGLGSKLKHLHFTRLPSFEKSYNILSLIATNIVDCVYRWIYGDLESSWMRSPINIGVKFDSEKFSLSTTGCYVPWWHLLLFKLCSCFVNTQISACNQFKCPYDKVSCYCIWNLAWTAPSFSFCSLPPSWPPPPLVLRMIHLPIYRQA